MKKRYIFFAILIALLAIVFWKRKNPLPEVPMERSSVFGTTPPSGAVQTASSNELSSESNFTASHDKRMRQMSNTLNKLQEQWRTPIEFYGKVVDENTNPVQDAKVDFDCNDTSPEGTSFYHTTSDSNGLFSIRDIQGLLLGVKVNKDGYYPYLPNGDNFYYAGQNQNFVPDVARPVLFRLRKKGGGEPLTHFHKSFKVPKDGTPIQIDLATGNLAKSGEHTLEVECWTHDTEKKEGWKYDWKCQVSVPGGGLQIFTEQFPFLAPNDGYISQDTIDMTLRPNVSWTQDVQRQYYVQTADGKFARVVFGMVAGGDHFCVVDCYFNSSGSRVLEPQQQ
jgi:hypothetical protein